MPQPPARSRLVRCRLVRSRLVRCRIATVLAVALLLTATAGCATSPRSARAGAVLQVAASTNVWASILSQLGGSRVRATSIISNPATDPHAYEPTPADARAIADSRVFVENGVGYDPWAARTIAASPDQQRKVIDVGRLVGVASGGNPHRWYSPADVATVADAISAALKEADPADAGYFDTRRRSFGTTGLAQYHRLIKQIRAGYAGTAIGASESVFVPMAEALGLQLKTPASFLKAISEGSDPSAADKAVIEAQFRSHAIKLYVFNSQNASPDVRSQVDQANKEGIPVVAVTETLTPAGASFQQWQVSQLTAVQAALAQASGR
jgi:zinc/manganese transport system substrate-binding protein